MNKIIVEWFRYEKEGSTCCRCSDSTGVVRRVVKEFKARHPDIDIELREISLGGTRIDLSNTVRINGRDIMDVLGERQVVLTFCPSCSELMGKKNRLQHLFL